jgi:heme-degrading monooxygenase HmoA
LVDTGQLRQHIPPRRFAMIVTVFRSRLMPDVREEYIALVDRMAELAASMPGYISHKGFFAEDGERCTIVEFESEEAQRAWRMNAEHREAQRKAREIYYETYSLQICELKRETKFDRNARGQAAE